VPSPRLWPGTRPRGGPPGWGAPGPIPADDRKGNAFDDEDAPVCGACQNFNRGCGVYVELGALGLRRQHLGHSVLAVLDPQNTTDTGLLPPRAAPTVVDYNDISPNTNWGVKAAVGWRFNECNTLEVSGFYLPRNDSFTLAALPNRLDLPFAAFAPPFGFTGDNFQWLQADVVRASLQTTLGNAEVNYRWGSGAQLLLGVRYLDLQERLSIFTGDDDLTVLDVNGQPDPHLQATYSIRTHNRLVAPQLGFDWNTCLLGCFGIGFTAKGAWGPNFLTTDITLKRGDGFEGPAGHRSHTIFSHVYELNVYADWYLCDKVRLRGGYNALWALHVAEAVEQVNYDLSNPLGHTKDNGSIYYHGPSIELHLLF